MLRTKYLVLGFIALGISIFTLILGMSSEVAVSKPNGFSAQVASVASSRDEVGAKLASVSEDSMREKMRATLISKLETYEKPKHVEATPPKEEIVAEPAVEVPQKKDNPPVPLFCSTAYVSGLPLNLGPVNNTLIEGIRLITSTQVKSDGAAMFRFELPEVPTVAATVSCIPQKDIVAIGINGARIQAGVPYIGEEEGLVGYALDGFPLYGTFENEKTVVSKNLDECHGHTHTILVSGEPVERYHYHVTEDAPYTISCFTGTPISF